MLRHALAACSICLAGTACAQSFNVTLGGGSLGTLSFTQNAQGATLLSTLDNTPLGVFNGTFKGTSMGPTARDATFVGESRSSRKQRVVTVKINKGRATQTQITPIDEQTDLSDVARVPDEVMDPVRIIEALLAAQNGCPAAMRLYDGRRVVSLTPTGQSQAGDMLACALSYRVTDGPGHLSPLRIAQAKMQISYSVQSNTQSLRQIKVSSGIFGLRLDLIE